MFHKLLFLSFVCISVYDELVGVLHLDRLDVGLIANLVEGDFVALDGVLEGLFVVALVTGCVLVYFPLNARAVVVELYVVVVVVCAVFVHPDAGDALGGDVEGIVVVAGGECAGAHSGEHGHSDEGGDVLHCEFFCLVSFV